MPSKLNTLIKVSTYTHTLYAPPHSEWRWERGKVNHKYMKILRKFLDDRDSEYSLQMIALQGADFGRAAGTWLGPNNVAQAIKYV